MLIGLKIKLKMKILCISDTHSLHKKIPKEWMVPADILIHAGDISSLGYTHEIKEFCKWFDSLDQYDNKIFIAGNHDWGFQPKNYHNNYDSVMEVIRSYKNFDYLIDEYVEITNVEGEKVKIYGSPWQPEFHQWAFNLQRGEEIQKKWDLIPNDTDVLITHGPPYGIGDFVPYKGGEYVGCKNLLDTIATKLPNLKAHIFGHIHYSYGVVMRNNVKFVNASNCNERYEPIQKPILIEI
jgi:Icc-related predicted phosphoesterase